MKRAKRHRGTGIVVKILKGPLPASTLASGNTITVPVLFQKDSDEMILAAVSAMWLRQNERQR